MDVKWLPGWEEHVRIESVNIVDEASNLQRIYPFFEFETSQVLLREYRHWTRALKVGAISWSSLEKHTSRLAGRVEVRGRYFEDLLLEVLAPTRQSTKSEERECVV